MEPSIFISYRQEDSAAEAGRLWTTLLGQYGAGAVFMDTSSVQPGAEWPPRIRAALDSARVVLVILGPRWLLASDEWGQRRIDQENDWVRVEVTQALGQNKEIIPVLVDGAGMPPADKLPKPISTLTDRQALEIRTTYWEHDIKLLLSRLESLTVSPPVQRPIGQYPIPPPDKLGPIRSGQVITFYSYKGGVGRSFALANVAALLARWGWRVLCVDWDLDAPGLSYYLRTFRTQSTPEPQAGLLEMVESVVQKGKPGATDYVTQVRIGRDETLDVLTAGREDESYARRVQAVNWEQLYAERSLGVVLEEWRAEWMQTHDVVLVDSRAGITDIGGICAVQLPDVLVLVFTANQQSVDGVLRVLDSARAGRSQLPFDRPQLLTVPLPSRFELQEQERTEQWRRIFKTRFAHCYRDWADKDLLLDVLIGHTTIPYSAYWSFGEDLPVLSESLWDPSLISYQFATLAALLMHGLEGAELLVTSRDAYVDAAMRPHPVPLPRLYRG